MKKLKNLAALTELASKNITEVLKLSVDQIESKRQVRTRFENIDELASSFQTEGQQTPITVIGPNSNGLYTILRGERRWRAAKLAGFETIDALVCTKDQNQSEIVAGQLVENIQREDLTALEIAYSLRELKEAGWSNKLIAQRLGKSDSYVSTYLSLSKLPEELKELNYKGYVTDATSLVTLRKMYELDSEKTKSIAQEIENNQGITRNQLRKYFSELQEPVPPKTEERTNTKPNTSNFISPTDAVVDKESDASTSNQVTHSSSISFEKQLDSILTAPQTSAESIQVDQTGDVIKDHSVTNKISDPITNLGARKVNPSKLIIEVLVTEKTEDYMAQLLVEYVSANRDKAWILVDGTPKEVDVGSISILEIRTVEDEN